MIRDFGTTSQGKAVQQIMLSNDQLTVSLLTLGVALQDVRLQGVPHSLTVGSQTLPAYESDMQYSGTIMGPVANRIGGARADIDGQAYRFGANLNGRHTLHGGDTATHTKIWTIGKHSDTESLFHLTLANGEGGFPGTRHLSARYQIIGADLRLTLTAKTTAPTLMNLANHSYWNLGPSPTTAGHHLTIKADHYLPGDITDFLPTGEIADVTGTRFDYRNGRAVQAGAEGLIDNNFCLSNARRPIRHVATLTGLTGVEMQIATTEPGLQIFDGHILGLGSVSDMDGNTPQPYAGLAIEAQFWPDAPNNPAFPSIILRPNQSWQQITNWTFSVKD